MIHLKAIKKFLLIETFEYVAICKIVFKDFSDHFKVAIE